MDFSFTKEQLMLVDSLRDMGKRENFPELAAQIDATGEFPHQLMPKYADYGAFGNDLVPGIRRGGRIVAYGHSRHRGTGQIQPHDCSAGV